MLDGAWNFLSAEPLQRDCLAAYTSAGPAPGIMVSLPAGIPAGANRAAGMTLLASPFYPHDKG